MSEKNQRERAALTAAMDRLLAGKPLRVDPGVLTQTALAADAGLHRSRLVNVHTDLRDEFEARKKAATTINPMEQRLRAEIAALKKSQEQLRQERDSWKATATTFARGIQVLRAELADAKKSSSRQVARLDDYRA
jgi:septal ring factor EnvC (AmiA/AmiB activator)